MTPISMADNPAVVDPRHTLTPRQREIVGHVDMFTMRKRKSEYVGAGEVIGTAILKALKNHGLVKEVLLNGRWILRLTDAGKMALDRMKKRADEQ